MRERAWWLWLLPSLVVAGLDQWVKLLVQAHIRFGEPVVLTAWLDLVLAYNPGAAFSFLGNQPGWQRGLFVAIAAVASVVIVVLIRRHRDAPLFCAALSLILGGAVGNLVDRVLLGAVVDFIYVHAGSAGFPAFNLADSAITAGVGLLLLNNVLQARRAGPPAAGA